MQIKNSILIPHSQIRNRVTPADCRKGERLWKPPQGAAQSRVIWVRILYLEKFARQARKSCTIGLHE